MSAPFYHSDELMARLGQHLVTQGLLTPQHVDELNARHALTALPFDQLLRESGLLGDAVITRALSSISGIPQVALADYTIPLTVIDHIPSRTACAHRILPIHTATGALTLATISPPTPSAHATLRQQLGASTLHWTLCTEAEMRKALIHFYGLGAETIDDLVLESDDATEEKTANVAAITATDSGMPRFIHQIIAEAIRMDATDIHIEPFENTLRLRYRIDGMLQEIPLPKNVERTRRAIVSTIKVMASMDIAERRKPHDGRIKIKFGATEYDLRISVLPTNYGETVNLRILNRNTSVRHIENLGLSPHLIPKVKRLTEVLHGIVLLTGPTGSGKTTTLYALLSRISTVDKKIITIEDPIEYQMHGINQIQVHSKIDLTFATALRSVLRHDPDVLLIGEIRDSETAEIAVRSSLTGHLVLSTLHTNDAPSAIIRLMDMRIEPYLIASCLEGVIAQRLVRQICPVCHRKGEIPEPIRGDVAALYPDRLHETIPFLGNGCPDCNYVGYRGRCAISEIMTMSDPLRALIGGGHPVNLIREQALRDGMLPLKQDGWARVLEQKTTVEEIYRVVGNVAE